MVNEVLLVENLLQGIGINKKCLFQHCYLMAKYFLQQGLSPLETRKRIFDWACKYHLYLDATSLNINRLIYKAQDDKRRLNEEDVNVSAQDIKEITDRFDSPKTRKTALALLCYAKAFADRDNCFSISVISLCNWVGIGKSQMYVAYLKELQAFDYIEQDHSKDRKIHSWDGNVKSQSDVFKLKVKFNQSGEYQLRNNDIDKLYQECFS